MDSKPFTGTVDEVKQFHNLWSEIFPDWPISPDRFARILKHDGGYHVIHPHGFCIGQLAGKTAMICAMGVLEEYRKEGLGTKLMRQCYEMMREKIAMGEEIKYQIKSGFPRFWSGVPKEIMSQSKGFFLKQGFSILEEKTDRDYYRQLTPSTLKPYTSSDLIFAPWTPAGYDECMAGQTRNFGHNAAWVSAYAAFAAGGLHSQIMVAHSSTTGKQVAWTLMASPDNPLCKNFAFIENTPAGGKGTGLIACVGVDKEWRGKGVGRGLIKAAERDMAERGIQGVFIDSAILEGFYEGLGYEVIFEYEKFSTLSEPPTCMT